MRDLRRRRQIERVGTSQVYLLHEGPAQFAVVAGFLAQVLQARFEIGGLFAEMPAVDGGIALMRSFDDVVIEAPEDRCAGRIAVRCLFAGFDIAGY